MRRYHARALGPRLFFPYDIPETKLEWIDPGSQLPGGLVAIYDGRGRNETPLWLPEQRALVFADALTAPRGELRVWATPWHQERALPALRALLDLPFVQVIGSPVSLCTLALPMNVPWVSRLGADSGRQEFWPARRSK